MTVVKPSLITRFANVHANDTKKRLKKEYFILNRYRVVSNRSFAWSRNRAEVEEQLERRREEGMRGLVVIPVRLNLIL